ncbi:hypothetical protein [Roseovarius sp. M141]|uniref:hypothetical protein n=1 Tax=Roseovarius sp. M141 TaxID=2583806 RepID=UPI0020CE7A5A|nr:hypothetical protein [Roseovarius sp. M141]MCQ0093608.1 hypothetical protein [Roseovarius sp. M141]
MSAPDTNTEKKKPAHKTPIVGMIGAVVFALLLLFGLVTWLSFDGNTPGESDTEEGINSEVLDNQQQTLPDSD